MSVVHVLQLNNHPADITSLFVEEYMNFYFKHMTVLNVKKQCDLFKVNFCGCQQQKICTFCHFITVSAIWPHWLPTDCRLTADWLQTDCRLTADWLQIDCRLTADWQQTDAVFTHQSHSEGGNCLQAVADLISVFQATISKAMRLHDHCTRSQ